MAGFVTWAKRCRKYDASGLALPGERRDRRVVAHRVHGIPSGLRDRPQHQAQLLPRVPVERMPGGEVLLADPGRSTLLACRDGRGDPGRVRLATGELPLELAVEQQASLRIDGQLLAGAEPRPPHGALVGERDRPRLGGDGNEPVAAHRHAERTQAVAVERGAAHDAVRVDETGRPVPRLDEHGVISVHRALGVVDPRVVLPRRRHQHRDGLPHVHPGADHGLEGVVEDRRVRPATVERRRKAFLDPAHALARFHPGAVSLDRVDLAVVAEQAEGLCPLPARLGVGREALVEDRPGDRPLRVGEIGEERRELGRGAEGLVRDRPEGERGDVDARHRLGAPPRPVGAELAVGVHAGREHQLRDPRQARGRRRAERRDVVRDVAPPERIQPLQPAGLLDDVPQPRLAQEAHRDPAVDDPRERRREREQDAGSVPRDAVRRPGAAVRDGAEPGERAVEDLARRAAARVGDEADAAGIALDRRVVERSGHGGAPFWRGTRGGRLPPVASELVRRGRERPASARCARRSRTGRSRRDLSRPGRSSTATSLSILKKCGSVGKRLHRTCTRCGLTPLVLSGTLEGRCSAVSYPYPCSYRAPR